MSPPPRNNEAAVSRSGSPQYKQSLLDDIKAYNQKLTHYQMRESDYKSLIERLRARVTSQEDQILSQREEFKEKLQRATHE
jgi:vacuolar-type H+-ATPase subunit I/STV1